MSKECEEPRSAANVECRNCSKGKKHSVASSLSCLLMNKQLVTSHATARSRRIGPRSNAANAAKVSPMFVHLRSFNGTDMI